MADDSKPQPQPVTPFSILGPLPDPIIVLRENRHILYANFAARELLGASYQDRDFSLTFRHPAALEAVNAVLGGAEREVIEISLSQPVHQMQRIHVIALDRNRFPEAAVLLRFNDITDTRNADQMRRDFVANVSHELRSPLASLSGFIETLLGPAADDAEARTRFLNIMQDEAGRMTRLIDGLLSLSRVEVSEHVRPNEKVEIHSILKLIRDLSSGRAEERNMTILFDQPEGLDPIAGDRDELIEVFQNLTDNAIKYGAPDSVIRLSIEPEVRIPETGLDGIKVTVHNAGEPIPKDAIPRLTERFYRVDSGRSRELGGSGLGLAIVKHVVSRHRGRLVIESKAGTGTTVSVYLPKAGHAGEAAPG